MKNLAKRFYLSGMLISLAVVFSIMSSLSAQNFEVNLSSTQTNLIEKSKPKTFVIDAGIDYLTKPFDADIYHHRSHLSDGGKAAFDLIIKDLLDFEPLKEQKNYVFNQKEETISYNLKDFGIQITKDEARNFNLVLGFDDSRLINLKFGQYQANKTPRYSDTDGDGFIDTLTLDIVSGYAKDPAKYKDDLLAVEKGLVSVFSRITEDMTDAQRVGVAIGGVYSIIKYGQRDVTKPGNHISILAVLNAHAICGGYSHLNQYILQRLGLKSLYLEGSNHDKIGHAWNWVEVDGQWYEYEVSFKGASELMYYTDGLISQAYGRGTRSYNFPVLANKGYHYVGSGRNRFVAPGTRVVDVDIMGLSESDLNDVTLSATYNEKIRQGMIRESAKPTDKEVNNAILTVGSNATFKQNLIGSRVTSMNINGVLLKIDNNVDIQGKGAFIGGHSQGSGNINDAVVLLGDNNTINVEAHGALNDSQGGVGGAINNVYMSVENNNVFGKKLALAEIKNNIKETFDQEVLATWTNADYEAAMKGTKQWPKKLLENISNANISNIMASFGSNNTFKEFVGARHEGTGNISNVLVAFGNDTTINGKVDMAIANSGNISNVLISFGNDTKISGNMDVAILTDSSDGSVSGAGVSFGNNAAIDGNLTVANIKNDITDAAMVLGDNAKIKGDITLAVSKEGNIENTVFSMGNNIVIKDPIKLAITNEGNISNTVAIFGNDIKANGDLLSIKSESGNINDTNITLGNNAIVYGGILGATSTSGVISNTLINIGNDATIMNLVGAKGTKDINNTSIMLGNNAKIIGSLIGATSTNGDINNTLINVGNDATIIGLVGAKGIKDISNSSIVLGNNVNVVGSIIGGETTTGDVTNSLIVLSGITKTTGDVIGGVTTSGSSTGHGIYMHDSVNADRIIGGRIAAANDNSKATNNLIYIDTEIDMPNTTLYGGLSDNGAGDVLSGNKLYFSGKKGIFKDIKNFENIEIDASGISQSSAPTGIIGAATSTTPTTPTNTDDAIITLTGTEVTNLDKTNVSLLLDANSNAKNINIFKKASGTITAPKSASAKVLKGVSMIEEFALKMDGNNTLSASWTAKGVAQEKTQNVGTAAISESELLLAGNDAIDLVFLSKSIKSNTLETFGMIRGGNIETTSGANTNTKTVNLIAGVGKNISDNTQYGVFFEGGYGSYTSRSNTIQGASDGKGSNTYYGAGLLFSSNLASRTYRESNRNQASRTESNQAQASNQARTSTSNIYLEASIRLGQIKTDYSSDNLGIENVSRSARFNTTKLYYGGHIGLGNLFKISQKSNIDLYAKAYYGQIGQDSVALGTGDRLSFSAVNSLIGKLGARYNYNIANNFALYAGSSYEYEVLGNIKTLNEIANISYKSLKDKRDTFAIEGGTQIQPINSDNVILNIHAKYLMGARQGIAGSVKGSYRF